MAPARIAIAIEALVKRGDGLWIRMRLVKRANRLDAIDPQSSVLTGNHPASELR